jgi:hypothetical protein
MRKESDNLSDEQVDVDLKAMACPDADMDALNHLRATDEDYATFDTDVKDTHIIPLSEYLQKMKPEDETECIFNSEAMVDITTNSTDDTKASGRPRKSS